MPTPWIGSRWGAPDNLISGVKLLLLGESFHDADLPVGSAVSETYTRDNVSQFIDKKEKWRFYRVNTALIGNMTAPELTDTDILDVWESIAFCNYVPVVAAQFSRERPTREMFEAGALPLRELFQQHKPDAVLACGADTWHYLLKGFGFNGMPWQSKQFETDGILMRPIMHPSSSHFSYGANRPVLAGLLSEVLERRSPGSDRQAEIAD